MKRDEKKYSIGLDIGTTSVGWAILDNKSKLIKKGNDPLWGYSIFEEGRDAADRRAHRSTRRRYTRRKQRIHLLQDLCSEMIYPKDALFYKRLENSYLVQNDRDGYFKEGGILFGDCVSDAKYYNKFPTIYHLRDYLMKTNEKADPRLIYLALHHIVKYRGNFLYEGQKFSSKQSDSISVTKLEQVLYDLKLEPEIASKIYFFLSNESETKKDKQKRIKDIASDKDEKVILEEIAKALLGYKFSPGTIVGIDNSKKISFNDNTYEEFINSFSDEIGETVEVIYILKEVYNSLILKIILNSNESISESMIEIYNNHKEDLKLLKSLLISNPGKRKKVLNEIYDQYINKVNENPKDKFYKLLKDELNDLPNSKIKEEIFKKIDDDKFLRRQNSTDNGAIPFQLHYLEAEAIIDNQKKYYKCLENNKEKILSIISFKRPYYLGPSNGGDGKNKWSWMVNKKGEPLRPWNWTEVVDIDVTAQKFIDRMRNHCTYILEENTLPKNSILLNRFNLLNELNKIKFDGKFLFTKSSEKENVINSLFLKKSKVSKNVLIKWLIDNQKIVDIKGHTITGFQAEDGFASNLKTEIAIRKIVGYKFDTHLDEIETIIEYITIYNDKEMIKRRIKNNLKTFELTDEEIDKLANLDLKGYGRFSRKLIDGLISNVINKNPKTILGYLFETNDNFMQILNKTEYGFLEQVSELNYRGFESLSYDQINDLATSPANKRAIWQSVRVVEDIVKFMKHDPEAIYIEFAREEGKKERTNSRFKQLEKIYKEYCDKELQKELFNNSENISNEKIYLYFIQQGKCLYSEKELSLKDLSKYQVDHILPQSYIKDDSLENKALVIASENQRKKDNLLLDQEIVIARRNWWKKLLDQGLIGQKKYRNLTRTNVSENEKEGFVARQLVETRQICVHVRNVLKNAYPKTEIGTVHAPLSSEFRHKFNLYKIRNLNNAHHANDAYLTALIGGFIRKETPYLFSNGSIETRYINKIISNRLNEETKKNGGGAEKSLYSIVIHKMANDVLCDENGEIYWDGAEQISYIKKIFNLKKYFFNYQTRDYDGSLYNATIYPAVVEKGKTKPTVGKKKNMPVEKYGGYSSIEKAFAVAVEYKVKEKSKRIVIDIPAIYANSPVEYIVSKTKDHNAKILEKIRMNQTFIKDGSLLTMSSAVELSIREQIYLDENSREILYNVSHGKISKYSRYDLIELYITILKKAYDNIPTLRTVINTKLGGNEKDVLFDNEESLKYARSLFNELNEKEIAESIIKLLNSITSKSHPDLMIGKKKIADRFGRLSNKTIELDDVEFVYTSPSGIYKTVKKL